MKITPFLSDKLKVISLILIILVLYIHSGFHTDEIEGMELNQFVQSIIGGVLGRLAVPLFFIISGFLFFKGYSKDSFSFKDKLKSRFRSLFIPYIIGCLFVLLWIFILAFFPYSGEALNNKYSNVFNKPFWSLVRNVFLFKDGSYTPIPYHLWFLRDLIGVVLLTPFLVYLFNFLKWYFVVLLLVIVTFIIPGTSFIVSILYFSIGAIFHFSKVEVKINKYIGLIVFLIYVSTSLFLLSVDLFNKHDYRQVIILVGLFGLWFIYDLFISEKFRLHEHEKLDFFCGYTFFIYIFHSPTINVLRKGIIFLIGKNELGYMISYLFSPLLLVIMFSYLGYFLIKVVPKSYRFITGGRV